MPLHFNIFSFPLYTYRNHPFSVQTFTFIVTEENNIQENVSYTN